MRCVFLFPGHIWFFVVHWAPNRQRTYRAKILFLFWSHPPSTEFRPLVSILFLKILSGEGAVCVKAADSAGALNLFSINTRRGLLFALIKLFR
jgi:hypothetical protein